MAIAMATLFLIALMATVTLDFKLSFFHQGWRTVRPPKEIERGTSPTVLFVVNTYRGNFETRVKVIRETYLKRIQEKSSLDLIFISNMVTDGNPDMFVSTCRTGYFEDSCKRADMITIAGEYLQRPGMEELDWIFFLDDDAYILPDNVQRVILKGIDKGVNMTAVFGLGGCFHEGCVGICGGGGYYMNRETLFHVITSGDKATYPTLRDEVARFDMACGRCGDLAITRVLEELHGVPLHDYPAQGIYIWDIDGRHGYEAIIDSLKQEDPDRLPWLYHYPAYKKFRHFQQWVTETGANKELPD